MKVLFEQCMVCEDGILCACMGFERCLKIEAAGKKLGVPVKQKDISWDEHIPFGVYMGLKHLVEGVV